MLHLGLWLSEAFRWSDITGGKHCARELVRYACQLPSHTHTHQSHAALSIHELSGNIAVCPVGHVTAPTSTVLHGFSKLDSSEHNSVLTIEKMLQTAPSDVVVWHQLSASQITML